MIHEDSLLLPQSSEDGSGRKNKNKKYYFKTFEIVLGKLYTYLQRVEFIFHGQSFLLNIL